MSFAGYPRGDTNTLCFPDRAGSRTVNRHRMALIECSHLGFQPYDRFTTRQQLSETLVGGNSGSGKKS